MQAVTNEQMQDEQQQAMNNNDGQSVASNLNISSGKWFSRDDVAV